MFFSIYDKSAVKSVDFLEEFGTLYDLLIYLLDNSIRIISSTKAQTEFLEVITALKIIISSIKADVTDQSESFCRTRKCFRCWFKSNSINCFYWKNRWSN